jgi:hypothetical protein
MMMSICSSSSSSSSSIVALLDDMAKCFLTSNYKATSAAAQRLTSASSLISSLIARVSPPSQSSMSFIRMMLTGDSCGSRNDHDSLKLLWMLYTPLLPVAGLNSTPIYNHIRSLDATLSVVR